MIYDSVTLRGVIRSNLPPSLGAALSMGPAMGPGSMFGEPNERFCETIYIKNCQPGWWIYFVHMILKLGQFQLCSWRDQTKYSISDSSSNFCTLDWYDIRSGWLASACASSWGHQMTWRPCWQRPFSAHTESLPLSSDSWNFKDRALNTNTDRYK